MTHSDQWPGWNNEALNYPTGQVAAPVQAWTSGGPGTTQSVWPTPT